jgi:hypothetical protein
MNKQFREFERASGLEIYGLGARRDKWEAALEKYAELIIEECANIGNKAYSDVVDFTYIGDKIKDHFRVEE